MHVLLLQASSAPTEDLQDHALWKISHMAFDVLYHKSFASDLAPFPEFVQVVFDGNVFVVFRTLNMKTKHKNNSKELKAENCSIAEHKANTKGALINKNKRKKRADTSELEMSVKTQDQTFQRL